MRRIFAFNSPSFKRLGRAPAGVPDAELLDLILGEPRLLRRPLLVDGDRVRVGLTEVAP